LLRKGLRALAFSAAVAFVLATVACSTELPTAEEAGLEQVPVSASGDGAGESEAAQQSAEQADGGGGPRGLVLIAHGSEDRPNEWPLRLERAIRQGLDDFGRGTGGALWDFFRVNWYEASRNELAAPGRAYRLGRAIGARLAEARVYNLFHLVGHSAGAHLIEGVARSLDDLDADRPRLVHMTFLDPFVARSVLRLRWGISRFGLTADFAESYVVREDPVPFTNAYLRHAHNFDLTEIAPNPDGAPSDFRHQWPFEFYIEAVRDEEVAEQWSIPPAPALRSESRLDTPKPAGGVTRFDPQAQE
jgi:hypothetical protein